MKKLILIFCLLCFIPFESFAQSEFDLKPSQSMILTGKGPGQDAMKNPYKGQSCFAIIENIGAFDFSIRTQLNGKVVEIIPIKSDEIKTVTLLKAYELYLDTNSKGKAKARVEFQKAIKKL